MTDWLTAVLNSPILDKSFAVIIALTLLYLMHQDINRLISALQEFTGEIRAERRTATERMEEIRNDLRDIVTRWATGRK